MERIPLFTSHYSIGKSILTLEKKEKAENAPLPSPEESDSIVHMAVEAGLKEVYLVEDDMMGFMEAYRHLTEQKIALRFGLRLNVTNDAKEKNDESYKKTCKYVAFAKNTSGYHRLNKIYSEAFDPENFYYTPRVDYNILKSHWSNDDLVLAIPFYDSFIYQNTFTFAVCVPDLAFTRPVFFVEDNDLFFDQILEKKVRAYAGNESEIVPTKTIYYKHRKDFLAYMTFRCIRERTKLEKPNLRHMTSKEFCFEAWKGSNGKSSN